MILVKCFMCNKELEDQGGLLFSPPNKLFLSCYGKVDKTHLCRKCYDDVYMYIEARSR